MADSQNAAFWLPSHFLTDEDDFSHRTTSFKNKDYNYDFFYNTLGLDPPSSLDSPASSTGTEPAPTNNEDRLNINEDDEDFLPQSSLQHSPNSYSEKPWMFSTSPQSTLTGFGPWTTRSGFSSNGSPNAPSPRVLSPPLTHEKNDPAWELLYEAAGQVARLKMNALAAQANHHYQQNRGLLGVPQNVSLPSKPHHHRLRHLNSFYDFPHTTPEFQYEQVKGQASKNFNSQHNHQHQQRRSCGEPLGIPHSAWPPLRQNHQRHLPGMRSVFLNRLRPGSMPGGPKRQSTGTGVFLPRRAGTMQPPPEPRKKPTILLPARVVQAFNRDLEEVNSCVNTASNPRFGAGMLSEHEMIVARRNAILEQRRNMIRNEGAASMVGVGPEIRLPNDWTY